MIVPFSCRPLPLEWTAIVQFRQDSGLRNQMHRSTRDEFYSYVSFPRVNFLIKMAESIDADVLISLTLQRGATGTARIQ